MTFNNVVDQVDEIDSVDSETPVDTENLIESVDTEASKLPDTATMIYNYLLIGLALILIGATLFVVKRKRRLS